jgi:hypothetical protein
VRVERAVLREAHEVPATFRVDEQHAITGDERTGHGRYRGRG